MSSDAVMQALLRSHEQEAAALGRESALVRLVPAPGNARPAAWYLGVFEGIAHFERAPGGPVSETRGPITFSLHFPPDYLSALDRRIWFRVVRLETPLFHPNVRGPFVCLGGLAFGARLRSVVEQLYRVVSSQTFATDEPLDAEAARYYLDYLQRVRAFGAPPFTGRRSAARIRVSELDGSARAREEAR